MFPVKGLFRSIPCPQIDTCRLPNCIFSHELEKKAEARQKPLNPASQSAVEVAEALGIPHGDAKRRKLEDGSKASLPSNGAVAHEKPKSQAFVGTLSDKKPGSKPATESTTPNVPRKDSNTQGALKSIQRTVSPPPIKSTNKAQPMKAKEGKKETLNPRMVPKDPVGHAPRRAYLLKLHEGMVRLNGEVAKSDNAEIKSLQLSENELIELALDEEERIAREQTNVYANIIKMRIVAYKRMKMEAWVKERQAARAPETSANAAKSPTIVETGLSPDEEVLMLARLVARQDGLDKHGYVTKPPDESEIEAARQGVEASQGWEICDRCKTRFQVFPDRREDGALTSGGSCTYHWGKPIRPPRDKTDRITGGKEVTYSCCSQPMGSPGCTTCGTHVFKVSEAKRLAAVMPFMKTPPNPAAKPNMAVCFDCEMGYTCYGLELIRLTATSWPDGKPLIDVLVRPLGAVLDLNTRFSGVSPEQFFNASPFDQGNPSHKADDLRIVDHPAAARELLLSHISDKTPLLGHALENDLNAVRLVHPTIVDTILLFPHPRGGLPLRLGLRNLTKMHLDRDIQTGGAAGHDSLEDARATGELVRFKLKLEWKQLKGEGWTVKDGEFFPPVQPGAPVGLSKPAALPPSNAPPGIATGPPKKRKRPEMEREDAKLEAATG